MSDITSRLRASAPFSEDEAIMLEAASEIDRLRKRLEPVPGWKSSQPLTGFGINGGIAA